MRRRRYAPRPLAMLAIDVSALGADFDVREGPRAFEAIGKAAVVDIVGPLTQRDDGGWDSYEAIKARIDEALKSSCEVVILRIDSPGGDALGVFDVAREIRAMADEAKKPVYAYADGMIASAAYALATAASKVYLPQAAFVGSIGVLKPLVDTTAMDRMMGLHIEMLASGARKLDGNPHVAISKEAIEEWQGQVDSLASLFFDLVADARGLTTDAVRGFEGRLFLGESAVAAKLADDVMTWNELLAMVATGAQPKASTAAESKMTKEEMRAWLSEKAEGDEGDEADKAKAALKCLDEEAPPANDKKDEPAKKEEAKAEDPPPPAKKKDADGDNDGDQAKAIVGLAGKVHSLEAKLAAKEEAETRATLLAQRPDFSAETRATLLTAPLPLLREAVAKWPRIVNPAASASAMGTRGESQTGELASGLSAQEAKEMDERMGLRAVAGEIKHEGRFSEFGLISKDRAREILAKNAKKGAA